MRFVCDVTVGRLARYLRMLGFDAASGEDLRTDAHAPGADAPYFLTRKKVPAGSGRTVRIESDRIGDQIGDLRRALGLRLDEKRLMSRCLSCNELLEGITKEDAEHRVPEYVYHSHNAFRRCPRCGRIYWPGTHAGKMTAMVREIFRR